MNDAVIRKNLHRQILKRHHSSRNTIVVDEFGLKHGKCRADIAVINGSLVGYEIKSDQDSLSRLSEQVQSYNAVFDKSWIVVAPKYVKAVHRRVPKSWGILVCTQTDDYHVGFEQVRPAVFNPRRDPFCVAQLLWHEEASQLLKRMGESPKFLRQKRSILYQRLCELLPIDDLRRKVIKALKGRRTWRCRQTPFVNGDSFRLAARP